MIKPISWLIDTKIISETMKLRRNRVSGRYSIQLTRFGTFRYICLGNPLWNRKNGYGKHREEKADRFHAILDVLFEDRIIDWWYLTPMNA